MNINGRKTKTKSATVSGRHQFEITLLIFVRPTPLPRKNIFRHMSALISHLRKYPLLWIVIMQLVLIYIGFVHLWQHPMQYMLADKGDGIKNLFNLQAYVTDPPDPHGFFYIRFFNYPWGEYVNTTDNTPIFAILFRWFCLNVTDISPYALPIFEGLICASILLTAVLTYKVFYRLLQNEWIAGLAAMVLPWANPQTIRIVRGHFNLALAFFMVWAIWAFIRWVDLEAEKSKKRYWSIFSMIACISIGFLFHGYYIAILGLFLAALLFFYTLIQIRNKGNWKAHLIATIAVPALALVLCEVYMKWSDPFLSQRPDAPGGYDWMEQKVRFWSLFTSRNFYSFPFWIKTNEGSNDAENMGYLGHIALFGFTFLGLYMLARKTHRQTFVAVQKRFFSDPLRTAIFCGGLVLLSVNFGEFYYPDSHWDKGITIRNLTNPLLWLHMVTKQIEQFRSLGRFQWPFFWTFNIWAFYTLLQFLKEDTSRKLAWLWIPISALGVLELRDYVVEHNLSFKMDNLLHPKRVAEMNLPKIDYTQYQAVLFLPYYNVGAESRPLILDDHEELSRYSYQFYLNKRIPMLNVKLARTVREHAQQVNDWFHSLEPGTELRGLLNHKPILVIRDKTIAADSSRARNFESESRQFMLDALYLPERAGLQAIDSADNYVYYNWYPLQQKPADSAAVK